MEAPDTIIYSSFKLFTIYLEAVNLFTFVLDFYCQGLKKKKKVQGAVKEIREALGVSVLIGCLAEVPAPDWELKARARGLQPFIPAPVEFLENSSFILLSD